MENELEEDIVGKRVRITLVVMLAVFFVLAFLVLGGFTQPQKMWTPVFYSDKPASAPLGSVVVMPADAYVDENNQVMMAIEPIAADTEMKNCFLFTYENTEGRGKTRLFCRILPAEGADVTDIADWLRIGGDW